MKSIAVATVSRADYGLLRPVLRLIQSDPELELILIAAGSHLQQRFGSTTDDIEADGLKISERVEMAPESDSPQSVAVSMSKGVAGFASVYARLRPDILLVLGDRYETMAAVVAALPFNIPVGHIHGGESTQGAIDEAIRHSITKMSHLHFAATEEYRRRIIQMGEEPWRVTVSGAPGLDNLTAFQPLSKTQLEEMFDLDLSTPPLLVTFHPVTLQYGQTPSQIVELLSAIESVGLPVVFTFPGADTGFDDVIGPIQDYVRRHTDARLVVSMGTRAYFSLMRLAAAMVGNSSSGILEAASFKLPVVNVGIRQEGRIRPRNVIDVPVERDSIARGIRLATDGKFRSELAGLVNPHGDGHAADRILEVLRRADLGETLVVKRFRDLDGSVASRATVAT